MYRLEFDKYSPLKPQIFSCDIKSKPPIPCSDMVELRSDVTLIHFFASKTTGTIYGYSRTKGIWFIPQYDTIYRIRELNSDVNFLLNT